MENENKTTEETKKTVVIKRDGSIEEYYIEKIHRAIEKAFKSCKEEYTDSIKKELEEYLVGKFEEEEIEVDEIHNIVEQFLMMNNYFDISKSYILKRYQKALKRAENERLINGISEKLGASNIENQNANVDEASFGGRIGEAARYVTKDYALNFCMSKRSRNNHLNNEIYIHN